ncbi:MAG: glycosyltransferase [Coriobacteriia bacterium]|nr:glycosyltransferase [Coriobacteriia bacterium]
MPEFLYVLTIICVVLSYVTMGFYYFWVSFLAFFPAVQHCQEIDYSEDMEIYFFVAIPCLNEESVIVDTVRNILKTNMKNLRVIVIDDDSQDDTVARLMAAYEDIILPLDDNAPLGKESLNKKLFLLKRHLPDAQFGKGKSLNAAYALVSKIIAYESIKPGKCVMGIFDADSFVSRRTFKRVAVIMDTERDVGMVQARLRIGTSTRDYFLPLFQDLEFFTFINKMQNFREYTGTVSAAGNGQFNRVSAIDPTEPWTKCLLEDYDFSLRMLLKGWRTRLLQEDWVFQQGVLTYRKLVRQRSRWCQGGLQCIFFWNDIKNSRYLSAWGKVESLFFMLLPFFTLLAVFSQIISAGIIAYYYWLNKSIIIPLMSPFSTTELEEVLVVMSMFVFVPGLIYSWFHYRDTKENWLVCLLTGIFWPIYNLMQIPAVLKAVWRQMTRQTSWIKTQHLEEKKSRKPGFWRKRQAEA